MMSPTSPGTANPQITPTNIRPTADPYARIRWLPVTLVPRLALGVVLEPVVRDRLPGRGVGHERAPHRSHTGIAVEGAHSDAHVGRAVWVAAEEVGAALAAEAFLEPAVGMAPALHELLALQQAEGPSVDPSLGGGSAARALLTARAMAIAGLGGRLGELEPHAAAGAAAGEDGLGHQRRSSASRTPRPTSTAPVTRSKRRSHGPSTNARRARATRYASTEYQTRSKATIVHAISRADGSTGAPCGTNCGNNATKNAASLGFAIEVTRPSRSAERCSSGRGRGGSARPRSDCTPR